MKKLFVVFSILCATFSIKAQVGIGTTTPDASSTLDVVALDKGILIPRVSLVNVVNGTAPINIPATSLLVYNTNAAVVGGNGVGYYYWNSSQWQSFIGAGDIEDVVAGDGLIGGSASGTATLDVVATNGLTDTANDIRLGGTLIQNTTINQGIYGMTYNLNSIGDFTIQDAGVSHFQVADSGISFFGDDTFWRDGSTTGTNLAILSDDGNDGRFRILENGLTSVDLDANSQFIFNEQGLDRNFRVESNNASMLFVDAGQNRVGIGTIVPVATFHVNGGRVEFTGTQDANGIPGSGVLEIANSLRIDGNEIITNNNAGLHLQNLNNGDLFVDTNTLVVDASTNRVGIGTVAPVATLDVRGNLRVSGNIQYVGTITDISDRRLKENFENITSATNRLKQITGYSYNMIDDEKKKREFGVIAQDLQKVFPEMISVIDKENGYLGVSYIQLIPVLLEGIKEQQKEIDTLKEQLENYKKLEDRILALETNSN